MKPKKQKKYKSYIVTVIKSTAEKYQVKAKNSDDAETFIVGYDYDPISTESLGITDIMVEEEN